LLAGATAAWASLKVIAKGSSSGSHASANATGSADHPHALFVRVVSKPKQTVSGGWTNICGSKSKNGNFSGQTPMTRKIGMPIKNPNACIVGGFAQLSGSGHITVTLLQG
jgi:hypothetical protein